MGDIHRFQGHLIPYTHSKPVQKVAAFSRPGSNLPVQSITIWSVIAPMEFRIVAKEVSQIPQNLSPAYTDSSSYMSGLRLVVQHGEIRAGSQTNFRLYSLPVRTERGQCQTNPRTLTDPSVENLDLVLQETGNSKPDIFQTG